MRCGTESIFKMLLLQNIAMLFLLRDQHADDVKEDFEERTESEMRTSHETRGSHNNLILLLDITINTQLSELCIKDKLHLVGLFHYHRQKKIYH